MDTDRRSDEIGRLWQHVGALEKDVEANTKVLQGLHYAVLGLRDVPGSGLVNQVDAIRAQCTAIQRGIVALISTAVVGIGTQILLHYT